MSGYKKILLKILQSSSDKDISFSDLCLLLEKLGFKKRIKGSHHIFYKEEVAEILNIQPKESKAKPYQVKQVRNIIIKYKLGEEINV